LLTGAHLVHGFPFVDRYWPDGRFAVWYGLRGKSFRLASMIERDSSVTSTIGMVIALPAEAVRILGRRGWRKEDGRVFRRQRLSADVDLLCAISGMGIENSHAAAKRLMERDGAVALIHTGVSGGLAAGVDPADRIIARRVLAVEAGNIRAGWHTDSEMAERAAEWLTARHMAFHGGTILCVRQPVLSADAKQALHRDFGALAADMESAGVAQVAEQGKIPAIFLRSVCDPFNESVPSWLSGCILPDGRVRLAALLGELLHRPTAVRELFRMQSRFHAACSSLAQAWAHLLRCGFPFVVPGG
jgi:nucleoside phosphorylase